MLNQITLDASEMSFCKKDGQGVRNGEYDEYLVAVGIKVRFFLRLTCNASVTTILRVV
jgi:hypothetical protein